MTCAGFSGRAWSVLQDQELKSQPLLQRRSDPLLKIPMPVPKGIGADASIACAFVISVAR